MKSPQSIPLFKVDPDHIATAQAQLKGQIKEKRMALFYVNNEEVKLPPEESYLAAQEIAEIASFGAKERLAQFLISRWLSKNLLASLLQTSAVAILTRKGNLGKPFLEEQQNSLKIDFNISHTKDVTLVGIAQGMQIGVDVEKIAEKKNSADIAARFFNPEESKWIAAGADRHEQLRRFFRMWSMKEAVIKTVGGGVFRNIHQIWFQEEQSVLALQSSTEPWSVSNKWRLFEFDEIPHHACSIAIYNP